MADKTEPLFVADGRSVPATEEWFPPEGGLLHSRSVQLFLKNRKGVASAIILVILVALAAGAPLVARAGPDVVDPLNFYKPPSLLHIFGTDQVGRDIWARTVYGGRISLFVGIMAMLLRTAIGLSLGLISGYFGGVVDLVIQRIVDIMMAFPTLMLLLILVAVLGPSVSNVFIAIGLLSWPTDCRLYRGQVLTAGTTEYVIAARAIGAGSPHILTRHVLPNITGYVIVNFMFGVGGAILAEAGISYLGLGVPLPTPSWGNMIEQANSIAVLQDYWWMWVPPALMMVLCVWALNAVGDTFRDILDPYQSR